MATDLRTKRGPDGLPASRPTGRFRIPVSVPARSDIAWIWATAVALFALYATVSIRLHQRILSSGFDLGLNEQAVRGWAHLGWPIVELEGPGMNQLGDHFSPVLALIGPFYRLFPTPITLLVVQAALLAVAVVPLASCAQRLLSRRAAVVVAAGYGLSWGIAETVGFDFHEVAFAVPLTACSVVALIDQRYGAAVAWALPMLLVKEDLGVTVAVLGGLVAWAGRRRLGLATAAVGIAASAVEMLVIIPHFVPGHTFAAWRVAHHATSPHLLWPFVRAYTVGLFQPQDKVVTMLMLVAPTALLALRSRLTLLVVPTLLWRFGSSNWPYWGTQFHYNAALMPIVFGALIDTMRRWSPAQAATRTREALALSAGVTLALVPAHPLWSVVEPDTWRHESRVTDARAMLAQVPSGVWVAASNRLVPQLTSRDQVTVFGWAPSRPNPEYLALEDADPLNWPFDSLDDQRRMENVALHLGYVQVFKQGNYVLLHRSTNDTRQFPPPPQPSS